MDSDTTLKQLQDLVQKFCEDREWDQFHDAKDLAIGVVTEAAELLEHFRFKHRPEIDDMLANPEMRAAVAQEMADVLYFLLRMAQKQNIDLAYEFRRKMALNERRYPVAHSRGSNRKYTEL